VFRRINQLFTPAQEMSGVCTSTLCQGLLKIRRGMFWHTIKNGQIIYQMALENFSAVIMEGCPNVGISGEVYSQI
jgi:hypothetical protein